MRAWGRAMVAVLVPLSLVATSSGATGPLRHLPNLDPLPPFQIALGRADDGVARAIRFSTRTENVGEHALELIGGAPSYDLQEVDALQCVTFASRACLLRETVGAFTFHPAHGHWHFDDYARYELRKLDAEGDPVPGAAGLAAGGEKVSFCLLDTDRAGPGPHQPIYSNPPFYAGCMVGLQGISAGWADTYHASLVGQQIVIDGVPDGDYALVIEIDPSNRLFETDDTDNVSLRRLQLSEGGTRLTLLP